MQRRDVFEIFREPADERMAATLVGGSTGGGGAGAGGPDELRLTRIPIATAPRNATMRARIGATNNKPITARTRIRISHAYCVQPLPDGAVPVDGGGSLPVTTCVVCSSVAPPAAARGGAAEMRPHRKGLAVRPDPGQVQGGLHAGLCNPCAPVGAVVQRHHEGSVVKGEAGTILGPKVA